MSKKDSPSRASEILWLAVAGMTIFAGIHKTWNHGFASSWYFYIFTLVALGMFFLRKTMRKNLED